MMENASSLILQALEEAPEIQAAGKQSLLAIAARALVAGAAPTREGIAAALGLHESLLCAILVAADLLGDTLSRRELGQRIFSAATPEGPPRILLGGRAPELTADGELEVVVHCLEQARELDGVLEGMLAELATLVRSVRDGCASPALEAIEARAVELQRTKLVAIERSSKSKLGVPTEEAIRRRAAQAVRAVVQGLRDARPSPYLTPTVAGELAAAVTLAGGLEASCRFLLSLASFLAELPPSSALRQPGN